MRFEEKFPNYNVEALIFDLPGGHKSIPFNRQSDVEEYLRKHCLDKQRVKEAISNRLKQAYENDWSEHMYIWDIIKEDIFKELGLVI